MLSMLFIIMHGSLLYDDNFILKFVRVTADRGGDSRREGRGISRFVLAGRLGEPFLLRPQNRRGGPGPKPLPTARSGGGVESRCLSAARFCCCWRCGLQWASQLACRRLLSPSARLPLQPLFPGADSESLVCGFTGRGLGPRD